jgi:hypothetical protein
LLDLLGGGTAVLYTRLSLLSFSYPTQKPRLDSRFACSRVIHAFHRCHGTAVELALAQ